MAHTFSNVEDLQQSIKARWGIINWDKHFPWWRAPSKVRILIYADGGVQFNGGPFLGLQYVYNLLKSRAYHYVSFHIEFAHRDGSDPTATISGAKKLTDLDIINNYDEIWFFGSRSTPNLTAAEVTLMSTFMAAPKFGGVLVTGDHADLGRGIAGQLPRAGKMRRYPAPEAMSPGWNTTLEDGPDAGNTFDFADQSDDKPQEIRYKRYPLFAPLGIRSYRPHPVLCGPEGPIDYLPDHQHEGEAIAPIPAAGDVEWPTKGGHQERPEVIAWGKIKDLDATKHGQEIGVVSAYEGHNVDAGRIVADSTWHHWFDINLTGIAPPPSPYAGFDATPAGQEALKKIDAYFLNVGVWLAPPARQNEMRNAAWWSILWSDQMVEISSTAPIWIIGQQAIDALGRRAPRCTVSRWIFDWPIFVEKIPQWEWPIVIDRFKLINIPIEAFVAGGIAKQLMKDWGPLNEKLIFPKEFGKDEGLQKSMSAGVELGLSELAKQLKIETNLAVKFLDAKFDLNVLKQANI